MNESLGRLEFNFPWRSYQANLLRNFDRHISDNHFHVIAPPGSGKTILGIEIIRRLGEKTLVLAPTLTIRNQWEDRLQSFFTKSKAYESHSFNIKSPHDITFATYQSLHAFYKTFEDKNDYYSFFEEHNIKTLVLDEAHHLKNEWWNCLIDLKNNNPFFVVALTATPPYDSNRTEVSKYFTLCGEIDDEIAVPDLVREADLCAHQDFVYFSKPEGLEINFIVEYRQKIADFKDKLLNDDVFVSFIKQHRFFNQPEACLEELYSNAEYFSAILIFLNACGVAVERHKLEILGFNKKETITFPTLELEWLEVLFQNLLVDDRERLLKSEPYLLSLEKELRKIHVFEKRKVNFIGEELLYKSLASSPSKLKSIVSIVASEHESLNSDLRCVVLTDYIRKEFLNTDDNKIQTVNKIGVIPVFQYLRAYFLNKEALAVVSGSLVIIHKAILEAFNLIENCDHFSFTPLQVDNAFLTVGSKKKTKNSIVSIITELFENGDIKVLVGTKSLLGEGWDAPSINSLILASFVGSFVSSNQMRGRAIRKDPDQLNKTGNIWHLACVDSTVLNGGRDVDILRRRFEAFVGVSNSNRPYIENSFERLQFPEQILEEDVETLNLQTLKNANNRNNIIKKWNNAIVKGTHLTKEIKIYHLGEIAYKKQKRIYYFDAVRFFVAELSFTILLFYLEFILKNTHVVLSRGMTYFLYTFLTALLVSFGYKLYKAVTLYMRYGFLDKKIKKMGEVILNTLFELGFMTTDMSSIRIESKRIDNGDIVCDLLGSNPFENSLFSNALSEIIEPVKSPRYLIVKTNLFRRRLNIENFYSVPEIFGDKKANALVFQKYWRINLGRNKLFYTRHVEGRKLLLKARLFHVYNAFKKVSKQVVVWR
ncbi:DEAD/DEAH box helicase family protein [Flavivirga spongiicola]|uniref:DEAD/DEAH box helicase family protein n=1 Tax=Flavivirga spongiicola TaxID=421621 RepID=A0ABU7XTC2_9FLAO|nr:DEAD/DEAH box helicase family protein [Flavivirga sp. MEBiC05379]MDO5978752.1 DEAD/DEAH box helicase family protein [Flavivirga sp. MEBiC05379]